MSERMTQDEADRTMSIGRANAWGREVRLAALEDWKRARASEKALADALERHARQVTCPGCGGVGSRTCSTCDHGEKPTHHPEVVAALRLAGRL